MADTRKNAESAFDLFIETFEDKYPKATRCLEKDREELLAFYDFSSKALAKYQNEQSHRIHLCDHSASNQAYQRVFI